MNKKIFITFVIIIPSVVFLYLIFVGTMNYAGFCWDQKRYLSEEEKIRIAIKGINELDFVYIRDKGESDGSSNFDYIRYENVEEFLKKNPSCCRILYLPYKDHVPPRHLMDRIWGTSGGTVEINFRARYQDKKGEEKEGDATWYVNQQNCGVIN